MLLYAALNSCVLNTFVVNASAKGIRLDSVKLELEGELDLRGFLAIDASINPGYNELTLVCKVKGNGTKQQYAECLEAGTKYSPNFQSITRGVPIHYRLDAQVRRLGWPRPCKSSRGALSAPFGSGRSLFVR